MLLYNTGQLRQSMRDLDAKALKSFFKINHNDHIAHNDIGLPKAPKAPKPKKQIEQRVANQQEQAMVKDIFGINVDIYENM